jgi:hypothetical protein
MGKQQEKLFRLANPQNRGGTIESFGLKPCLSKLGCAKIIPTEEEESSGRDEIERSLAKEPGLCALAMRLAREKHVQSFICWCRIRHLAICDS